MQLPVIKQRLESKSIFYSQDSIGNRATVVGYEKLFKWRWAATQLNTFIVAADFESEEITVPVIEEFISEAYKYAKNHKRGWPRGLQSAFGVIVILASTNISDDAKNYCEKQKAGKKWAAFAVPVTIDSTTDQAFFFAKNPLWGKIYYPHFRRLIEDLTG